MPRTELPHDLSAIQSHRKTRIRLTVLLLAPLLLVTGGRWGAGTAPREMLEGVGVLLILLAIFGRAWSTLYIGGRKIRELVTAGPYSIVRNPLYTFSFLAVAGLGLQTGSLTLTALLVGAAYAIFLPVVRHEEDTLLHTHGPAFDAYRKAVPRFLPRVNSWRDSRELTIDVGRWRQAVLDTSFFLLLVPIVRSIELLQMAACDGPLFRVI